jgi:hypothetical protein
MFRLTATTLRATTIAIPMLLATAIAIPSLLATSLAIPASAQQISVGIGFDNFRNQLAPYGTWSNHARWGEVWHPRADRDFRPYYNGRWEDTREYGWLWVSDDSWGDVPYHYGRWVFDPREGWLWVPGYVWAPSWVVWREGGGNIGWFPMPPGDNYYGDGAYRDNFANQYGYRDWYGPSFGNDQFLSLWIFVGQDHFRDRNYRNYAVPQRDYGSFFSQTVNTTNYVTINNYVVNRSVDRDRLQRATNQRFEPVAASNVIGPKTIVTQAREGRQIEQRERQRRPIPASIDRSNQPGRDNLNPNAQQQNRNQEAPAVRDRNNDRGTGANGRIQASPQNERGAASPAIDTTRQKGREQANINPVEPPSRNDPAESKAQQQPRTNQTNQDPRDRGRDDPNSNSRARSNPQTDREPQVTNTPPQNGNAARQGQVETRGARDQQGKVIVKLPSFSRVQGNAPDADGQGKARANQTRANNQGDAKNADDQEKTDDKKTRAERGRN